MPLKMCAFAGVILALMAEPAAGQPPRALVGSPVRLASKTPPRPRRGRPRKFSRPSRSVTLTLPEDVIATLQGIDRDLSRAVVRTVQPLVPESPRPLAELTTFGDRAVIIVPPNRCLKERMGVELVPLVDGRALISFDERLSVHELELRVGDALADPTFAPEDRAIFEALSQILATARRSDDVSLQRRSIIVLQLKGTNGNGHGNGHGNEA